MKKLLSIVTCFLLLVISIPTNVFAAEVNTTINAVYDTRKLPQKSYSPKQVRNVKGLSILNSTINYSSLFWSATAGYASQVGATAYSDSYTSSNKSTRAPIDHIYAKVTAYVSGSFQGSKTDNEWDTSRAGACVGVLKSFWQNEETYGNHTFEESGFESWYPDTYYD